MNISLLALVLLATPSSPSNAHKRALGPEIYVRTESSVSIERLAKAVAPIGFIESRVRGSNCFLIQLNAGLDDEKAKQQLEKVAGVRALEPAEEPFDLNSVSSLNRKVKHLMEDENEEQGKIADGKKHEADADYLRAYQYFLGIRAYPNDTFDWSSWSRGRAHARQMLPTKLQGRSQPSPTAITQQFWEFMGPTNLDTPNPNQYQGTGAINGRVNALAYDPNNSQIIYAGAAQGGVWKTTDGGKNWSWLSKTWNQLAVNAIVVDPVNTDNVYVAMGDWPGNINGSYGIMKSTDGGSTWNEILTAFTGKIGVPSLLMDPTNSQILIAGTGQGGLAAGLWRSSNGGQTWQRVYNGGHGDTPWFTTLASSAPSNGKVRFYTVEGGYAPSTIGTGPVAVSDDHGKTWTPLSSPIVGGTGGGAYSIATSPTNSQNVYILDSQAIQLFKSGNQGGNWTNVSANLPLDINSKGKPYNFSQSGYDYYLACGNRVVSNKNKDVLYLGEIDVQESLDQGGSWQTIGGPSYSTTNSIVHNDQHCFTPCPTNTNQGLMGCDGGVYSLTYNPSTQTNTVASLNKRLQISMFWKIACHPTDPDFVLGGAQDNASPYSSGDLSHWLNPGSGDGSGSAINPQNSSIQYTTQDSAIVRTADGWSSQNGIAPSILKGETFPFVTEVVLDPNNPYLMYTGSQYLYQWNETNQSWSGRLGNTTLGSKPSGSVNAIAIAPTDSKRIYTGSTDAQLCMSTDQGQTWTFFGTLINAGITAISVDPSHSDDILVAFSGSGIHHIARYKSLQRSGTFGFQDVSGSGSSTGALPDSPINAIARDVDDPEHTWYVGTDVGIFQTNNSGQTWTNTGYAYGLPDVIIQDLVSVPGTRYLVAGTYGRGMWRLYLEPNNANLTNFTVNPNPIPGGTNTTGTVWLTNPAPSGGTVVKINGDSTGTFPSSVTVPAGSTIVNFLLSPPVVTSDTTIHAVATQNTIKIGCDLKVLAPALSSVSLGTSACLGGVTLSSSVNLTGSAAKGGIKVTLSSSNSKVKVSPTSVTIAAGSSVGYFKVITVPEATTINTTITAQANGVTVTAPLEVEPPFLTGLTASPILIVGGSETPLVGTLTIDGKTPPGGMIVKLSSSNGAVEVPSQVTVNLTGSETTANFTMKTKRVTSGVTATIQAIGPGGQVFSVNVGVVPFFATNLSLSPSSVIGGKASTGIVQINSAPSTTTGAIKVPITLTTGSRVVTFPASVTIGVGKTSGTFTINTVPVSSDTQVTFNAILGGVTQQANLTVQAPSVNKLTVFPVKVKGSSTAKVNGYVTLSAAAPQGGIVVSLSSSATAAGVPSTVTVPAGSTTAVFPISHKKVLNVNIVATITATSGSSSAKATLTITP